MTIEALCDQDTITVTPLTASTGSTMGVVYTAGTPVVKRCLVQELSSEEVTKYQSRGLAVHYEVFFSADPGIKRSDRLTLSSGEMLEVKGAWKEGRPGESLLWVVVGERVTSRER